MNLKEDKEGLLKSVNQIKKIIQQEMNSGISPQKIMVIGHSQGGAVALAVGLTSDYRLSRNYWFECLFALPQWSIQLS